MQAPNRFCSVEYDTGSYKFLVLNTMKTQALGLRACSQLSRTKLVKLRQLVPSIWSERQALQAEKEELAQSLACLENVENQLQMVCTMAALAASAPADDRDDATGSVDSSAARCFDRRWKQYRHCSSRIRRQCAGTRRSG
jgi:hypothetical protein